MVDELRRAADDARVEHDRRLHAHRQEHQEMVWEHQHQLTELQRDLTGKHERDLGALRQDYETATASMAKEHERRLAELGREHEKQLRAAADEGNPFLGELGRLGNEVQRLQMEKEQLERESRDQAEKYLTSRDVQRTELEEARQEAFNARAELARLESNHTAEVHSPGQTTAYLTYPVQPLRPQSVVTQRPGSPQQPAILQRPNSPPQPVAVSTRPLSPGALKTPRVLPVACSSPPANLGRHTYGPALPLSLSQHPPQTGIPQTCEVPWIEPVASTPSKKFNVNLIRPVP